MSGAVLRPRRHVANEMRAHDYLYDATYVVSGARDFARSAFKAAMASAQVSIRPNYRTMFCETRRFPSYRLVYHPNCRLPDHMELTYGAAVSKMRHMGTTSPPQLEGRDRYRFFAVPRVVLPVATVEPTFQTPRSPGRERKATPAPPVNRAMQTLYRESSAQTRPWQPDAKAADTCEDTPEVLFLDQMEWSSEGKYRTGDLPADFHTTEIINKMRHNRIWTRIVEYSEDRNAIIADLETGNWLFREAEIDELQNLRLELLGEERSVLCRRRMNRAQTKLHNLWTVKKQQMKSKIDAIHSSRDRELRKLRAQHESGSREARANHSRVIRGGGAITTAAADPASDLHAPLTRHGYQARCRHADITYYPDLLGPEEQAALYASPAWLKGAKKTTLKAQVRKGVGLPCERETKFGEEFLKNLHMSLKEARMGAGGPKAFKMAAARKDSPPRVPNTPQADELSAQEEAAHQSSVVLQRTATGRAVQMLMAEGCLRAAQLTAELRTTHGLQRRDWERVLRQQAVVRDLAALRAEDERKEERISSMAARLSGGALAAALDFLEKELRRLEAEKRHHAYILVAKREKAMREAAEAGRRQLEEERRKEHDLMFKQVIGVTQETVDAYLNDIIREGADLCAEQVAVDAARAQADQLERELEEQTEMSNLQQNEMVAELIHQLAIPEAQRQAARQKLHAMQQSGLASVRDQIFGLMDKAVIEQESCVKCGRPLSEDCKCLVCPIQLEPQEKPEYRGDPRWHYIRKSYKPKPDIGERYPPQHEFRCLLDCLVDDAIEKSRARREEVQILTREHGELLKEKVELNLDCKEYMDTAVKIAIGAMAPPVRPPDYHHLMYRRVVDAMEREAKPPIGQCPQLLPSQIRHQREMARLRELEYLHPGTCICEEWDSDEDIDPAVLLPSRLRALEALRRCKCDHPTAPSPSPAESGSMFGEDSNEGYEGGYEDEQTEPE